MVQRTYPPEIASAHRAQEFVAQLLGSPAFDTVCARIVTSELVTNAVKHARPPVRVAVTQTADHVRIDVADGDANCDLTARCPEPQAGRGLLFVEELARTWGVEPLADGKTVWAVLERPALDPA
jgi:anti-sigma regulatory factor (Ser/Thr protein kinase)